MALNSATAFSVVFFSGTRCYCWSVCDQYVLPQLEMEKAFVR
jgi:hypothetical protein